MAEFGPYLTPAAEFREQAERCRCLADAIGEDEFGDELRRFARENDNRAHFADLAEKKRMLRS